VAFAAADRLVLPDMMAAVRLGIHLGRGMKASNPAQFHRGWPGLGYALPDVGLVIA
jgi:hypothetical protein